MNIEFKVKLKADDVFNFNMYHSYHRFQTWAFTLLGLVIMGLAVTTWGTIDDTYTLMYILCGGLFTFYTPFNLKTLAKSSVKEGKPLSHELTYTFTDSGIKVRLDEDGQTVEWKHIYRIVETKKLILVYTSRINASILPKEQMGEQVEQLKELFKEQLPTHRLNLK